MRAKLAVLALSFLLLPAALPQFIGAQGGSAADEKAIRDVESRWEKAWNDNDVQTPASARYSGLSGSRASASA